MAENKEEDFTLEDKLLHLRGDVGDVKDEVLLRAQKRINDARTELSKYFRENLGPKAEEAIKKLDEVLPPPTLKNYSPHDSLKRKEELIHELVEEILENPILEQDDPRRTPVYNERQRNDRQARAIDIIGRAATLGTKMDFVGLIGLSNLSRQLYSLLKEPARQNRYMDTRTGVRVMEYLMGDYFFEILRDHFANPNRHIAFVNIDMNNLDYINGVVGKTQADVALRLIATYLKKLPEGVVVRNTAAADEFFVCFRTDAEGAEGIMQKQFVEPMEQEFTKALENLCSKELSSGYNNAINEYTCAIGITSTRIPKGGSIFQRAVQLLNGGSEKEALKTELNYLDALQPSDLKHAFHDNHAEEEIRRAALYVLREQFETESEKAMKYAKKIEKLAAAREKRPLRSRIAIYDPTLKPEDFVYDTQVFKKKD